MPSLQELWKALRVSTPVDSPDEFRMRLYRSVHGLRLFAAVKGTERSAAIVVEVATGLLPAQLTKVSGARLTVSAAEVPGLPAGRAAIVIELRDPQFEDLFDHLGNCLTDSIVKCTTEVDAVQAVVRQIERWRRFLEKRRDILSPEEVRGLIGELGILERLIARIGSEMAIRSWMSPQGSIRDFECPDMSIEVKTFMPSTGASVRISNPLQLEPDPDLPLILACLELSRSGQLGHKLPDYVAKVAVAIGADQSLIEQFENSLALFGYLPFHADQYSDGYRIGVTYALPVGEHFPRIRPSDVPPFVENVQFSVQILPLARTSMSADTVIGPIRQESANQ